MESDFKHLTEFVCESDSPIKTGLSDIPHVVNSEKSSLKNQKKKPKNKVDKMEMEAGGGGFLQNAPEYEENSSTFS